MDITINSSTEKDISCNTIQEAELRLGGLCGDVVVEIEDGDRFLKFCFNTSKQSFIEALYEVKSKISKL